MHATQSIGLTASRCLTSVDFGAAETEAVVRDALLGRVVPLPSRDIVIAWAELLQRRADLGNSLPRKPKYPTAQHHNTEQFF